MVLQDQGQPVLLEKGTTFPGRVSKKIMEVGWGMWLGFHVQFLASPVKNDQIEDVQVG